ncbi:MAG TPA: PQQ-dependent sugar dehydrogenase, partial [Sphingomicrobium sp.]
MSWRLMQAALLLGLAACGSAQSVPAGERPFVTHAVATFDSPWAMAFLPGKTTAIVTEKPGRLWLVDVASGAKQPVGAAPEVVVSSQGGLLDVVLSPSFAADHQVYLTYSESSPNGGSGLALARGTLVRNGGSARI